MENETKNNIQNNKSDRGVKSGLGLVFASVFLSLSTIVLVFFFIYTFFVPSNPLNPFPPKEETETVSVLEPESTNMPTKTPLPPTQTPKPFPEVVPTQDTGILFEVQSGTPFYLPHQSGCRYMFVAGNILDENEQPVAGYTIKLSGVIGDESELTLQAVSGSALQYSDGGFEIQIGDLAPTDTQNGIYLQVFTEDGTSASPMISFSTSSSCSRNLIYINFLQIRN